MFSPISSTNFHTQPQITATQPDGITVERQFSTPSAPVPSSAYQAQFARKIRFGHQLTRNDYLVAHGSTVPITADSSAKTLFALIESALFKLSQNDTSNLKYQLQAHSGYLGDIAATADNLLLLGRPVDTIVQSSAGHASTLPLQASRLNPQSRLYISKNATIELGPVKGLGYGTNHDWQITREYINEYIRDREALLQATTGEESREKLYKDLRSAKEYNALEALAYAKKGLVDAILVGDDKVLTRKKLDEFYQSKGWDAEQIADFNSDIEHINDIPKKYLTPLREFNRDSLVPETVGIPVERSSYRQVSLPKQFLIFKRGLNGQNFSKVLVDKDHPLERISQGPDFTSQIQYWLGFPHPGILYDDVLHFHTEFTEFSADQVVQALHALAEKKTQFKEGGGEPSNIKILVNSPGGSVWAGEEIRSAIEQETIPVDVIVQGMAASCGAYLLASATGNRFATPNARIMIHQPLSSQLERGSIHESNENADNMEAVAKKITKVIAKATGRPEKEVWQDMKQDTWMNPLEAMFYGPKGMLDGILVASNKAVTRDDVMNYLKTDPDVQKFLKEKFGKDDPDENVKAYLEDRLKNLREPNRIYEPRQWEQVYGQDPFSNPFKTLQKLSAKAKPLNEIPKLKNSASRPQATIDHFNVGLSDDTLASLLPFLPADEASQKAASKRS
jgi:ATP-dependent Clp protease protease subunit